MKVIWLINIMLPAIADKLGSDKLFTGGWLTGLYNLISKIDYIDLTIVFPQVLSTLPLSGKIENSNYVGFPKKPHMFSSKFDYLMKTFDEIIQSVDPDIIHIFGTEYLHSYAMTKTFNKKNKILISVQGLVSVYSLHYMNGIPNRTKYIIAPLNLLKRNFLLYEKYSMLYRGKYERLAISQIEHITGRTDWDKACISQINPRATYHFCNEILRDSFYIKSWNIQNCEKHSIFVSQSNYPIKGFHYLLHAMKFILNVFPDTHIYTTGRNRGADLNGKEKQQLSSYDKYIRALIMKYNLDKQVTFLGDLSEEAMCSRYCKSNVFVSASTIENSPNSVGEAMILGVPVVSSNVGGVKNMLMDGIEGFLYQSDSPYMLAYYVCKIFKNKRLADEISKNARKRALLTHGKEKISIDLLEIYNKILKENMK